MNVPRLLGLAVLLATLNFCLALRLKPLADAAAPDRAEATSLIEIALGDARRMFANHFFAKADAYFHRGVYPSIFDAPRGEEMHMVSEGQAVSPTLPEPEAPPDDHAEEADDAHHDHDPETCTDPDHHHEPIVGAAGKHDDWITRWNEHFSPTAHAHLEGADAREMLPWLKLSADLDPHRVQSYTVAAYWLRTALNEPGQAEAFLREGLRHNPDSPEILFELGEVVQTHRQDPVRARNLWERALDLWSKQEAGKENPNLLLQEQILVRLAYVEEQLGNLDKASERLAQLRLISPNPEAIDRLISALNERRAQRPTVP